MKLRKVLRVAAVVTTGGMLLQTTGCGTTLAPLALSLIENILLTQITGLFSGGYY